MADYYPKTAQLPQDVYNKTLWFVRGYDRMKREANELIEQSPEMDGQPKGTAIGDPVAAAAGRREKLMADIKIIEDSLNDIPEEYREVVLENVTHMTPFSRIPAAEYASTWTWSKYRMKFIMGVAVRCGYAEEAEA